MQGFERFLRTDDLIEDDIRLVLKEHNSSVNNSGKLPGSYTFKDPSEVLLKDLQLEFDGNDNVIDIEIFDIRMRTKLFVRSGIISIRFDEKSFFSTILGFFKRHIAYIGPKIINLATINKILLKCDVVNGSLVNGLGQTIWCSFIFDKTPGYKVFCETETFIIK